MLGRAARLPAALLPVPAAWRALPWSLPSARDARWRRTVARRDSTASWVGRVITPWLRWRAAAPRSRGAQPLQPRDCRHRRPEFVRRRWQRSSTRQRCRRRPSPSRPWEADSDACACLFPSLPPNACSHKSLKTKKLLAGACLTLARPRRTVSCGGGAARRRIRGSAQRASAPCCGCAACGSRPSPGTTRVTTRCSPRRLPPPHTSRLTPRSCPQAESPAAQLDPPAHGQHHPVRGRGSAPMPAWCDIFAGCCSLTAPLLTSFLRRRLARSPALQVQRQAAPLAPHEAGHLSVRPLGMRRAAATGSGDGGGHPAAGAAACGAARLLLRCGRPRRAGACAGVTRPPATDHSDIFSDTRVRAA